jgi:predicted metalloprotease with PDZ domain
MIAVLLALALQVSASPVVYEIRFDNADHHEADVRVIFSDVPDGAFEIRMSRSSPGRYALHEFAKNVYDVHAVDGAGRALSISRIDPHGWRVEDHRGDVEIRYKIFGDRVDGTYLAIDNTHAHMNMPATFVWARGMEDRRVRLRIVPASDTWKVATQLVPTDDPYVFEAPNLYYFLDSPTEVSDHELYEWNAAGSTIRLALHHQGSEAQAAAYAQLAAAVVREETTIFGELPSFDYGTYTFIADYLPYANGDGMEHRNSTILSSSRSLDHAVANLGTLAHEFFHSWNVERLRPRSLEPFDFERANMSDELWFAEGFTSYYDSLAMKRAGILSLGRYAESLSDPLNATLNAPGLEFFSPVGMSRRAPFVDAAVSVDPTNQSNIFVSYYRYGTVVALGLDLTIRSRFPGKTLDDFMRAAWRTYGKSETPYELADLEGLVAEITGDAEFAEEFFARYIYDSELPDYESLLELAGLELRLENDGKPSLGLRTRDDGDGLEVSSVVRGGPAYSAGLDRGDVLLELGGKPIGNARDLANVVASFEPGAQSEIVFTKRHERRRAALVLEQDPTLEVVTFESNGRQVTPEIEAFREAWLSSSLEHDLKKHCHQCSRSFPFDNDYCPYDGRKLEMFAKP